MLLDDRILTIQPFSPVCSICNHWAGTLTEPRLCKAFRDKVIPEEIWSGQNPHTTPYPGDNGILFEKLDVDGK